VSYSFNLFEAMTLVGKRKAKHKISPELMRWRLICGLLFTINFSFILCICVFVTIIFGHEITGTLIEKFAHYPNSEMIWSGYGAYGSNDYGDKVYYRWTPDDELTVTAHYDKFPEGWRASIRSVTDINIDDLWVCSWIGFHQPISYSPYESRNVGCETLKAHLPDYGTLISFRHDYFAG
jgi:hypothetical protein